MMKGSLNIHVIANDIPALDVDELVNFVQQAVEDYTESYEGDGDIMTTVNFTCKN